MRFSVALPTSYEGLGYRVGFADDPALFARLARTAERLGYDGVWVNDHLVTPRFLRGAPQAPSYYEALTTLAHVAAVTERVRLGTAVLALPLRDPVLLAKQVATVDRLSGGRLTLGVGVGAYREELAGARPERARYRRSLILDELVASLRMLLGDGGGSYDGLVIRFHEVALAPPPLQRPLPLYIGGHGREAAVRAARAGDGWMPGWRPLDELGERIALLRSELARAGRDVRAVAVAPELSARIAARHEDAVDAYEASRLVTHRRSHDRSGRDPSGMTAANLVGSPDAIRGTVGALAAAGVDECAALAFPAESEAELVEQWTMFAEEIVRPGR